MLVHSVDVRTIICSINAQGGDAQLYLFKKKKNLYCISIRVAQTVKHGASRVGVMV